MTVEPLLGPRVEDIQHCKSCRVVKINVKLSPQKPGRSAYAAIRSAGRSVNAAAEGAPLSAKALVRRTHPRPLAPCLLSGPTEVIPTSSDGRMTEERERGRGRTSRLGSTLFLWVAFCTGCSTCRPLLWFLVSAATMKTLVVQRLFLWCGWRK